MNCPKCGSTDNKEMGVQEPEGFLSHPNLRWCECGNSWWQGQDDQFDLRLKDPKTGTTYVPPFPSVDFPHCQQCNKEMNPVDYIVGPVCMDCCRANHKAAMGRA